MEHCLSPIQITFPDLSARMSRPDDNVQEKNAHVESCNVDRPLGRVIGQIANKYILAQSGDNLVIVDQHAAHERITYEHLRRRTIKTQPLLTPIVVTLRREDVAAVMTVADEMRASGLHVDEFGDTAVAIFEKPADWDLNWAELFHDIADEVRDVGHSSQLGQRLHLKLANWACHHSVRAGQKLDMAQMDASWCAISKILRGGTNVIMAVQYTNLSQSQKLMDGSNVYDFWRFYNYFLYIIGFFYYSDGINICIKKRRFHNGTDKCSYRCSTGRTTNGGKYRMGRAVVLFGNRRDIVHIYGASK